MEITSHVPSPGDSHLPSCPHSGVCPHCGAPKAPYVAPYVYPSPNMYPWTAPPFVTGPVWWGSTSGPSINHSSF